MANKVTVIIPACNEEQNIENVIKYVQKSEIPNEIIVVDNCSEDKTAEIALSLGVRVIHCNIKEKGYAMEMGLKYSKTPIVAFIDADIKAYDQDILSKLVMPILNENVDFVKSSFERIEGGKVTEIAIKPLLDIIFPDIYKFLEPLSGMIAGKRRFFKRISLEKDYGVDIGILLDMVKIGAKVSEVNIGKLENISHNGKTLDKMRQMSLEVMKAILKRGKYVEVEIKECG